MNHLLPHITDFLSDCGIRNYPETTLELLEDFRQYLEQVNRDTNLTRVTSLDDFWIKHIADSLSIIAFFPELAVKPLKVADVGCGGGFPLLPLACLFPQLHLTGIDTKHKKIDFVNDCCQRFGWKNCSGLALQAREAGRLPELKQSFGLVLSRAMSDCAKVFKECRGLLKPETGRMIIYKTPALIKKETAAAQREAAKYGFSFSVTEELSLPAHAGERQFAVFAPVAQ